MGCDAIAPEPDPRHGEIVLNQLGLEPGSRTVSAPARRVPLDGREASPPLDGQALAEYRSASMRLGYLALDWPDIGYACKELARHLHDARQVDAESLKKCGRYLL